MIAKVPGYLAAQLHLWVEDAKPHTEMQEHGSRGARPVRLDHIMSTGDNGFGPIVAPKVTDGRVVGKLPTLDLVGQIQDRSEGANEGFVTGAISTFRMVD